ncbi:hypothetical protein ICM05_01250 [Leucobacter sp. cx-42]|uniref:hypothetical protein n=1 Tax=unclassified Leucobacter TaxID=2621730 RepID=UPI00165E0CB5|nr:MULTISPECIES: hypothetical protein [unclassified Leucobacter]MBC9953275.1 hypothetical protein [Leucobacter sp. cx-42]
MYDPAFDPLERLADRGVQIIQHQLHKNDAIWIPRRNLIIVDEALHPMMLRPTLTHEWVHVINSDPGGHYPRFENRADLISARILTDPNQWADLTKIHGDYDHICLEIGITRGQFMAYYQDQLRKAA